jgi:hypothetical protein
LGAEHLRGDQTADGAPDGDSATPAVEIDARGIEVQGHRIIRSLQALGLQVAVQQTPFSLVARTPKNLLVADERDLSLESAFFSAIERPF